MKNATSTKPKRERLKPAARQVVALESITLHGTRYAPGDPIPQAALDRLSEKVRDALFSAGRLGAPDAAPTFTPAEEKTAAAVRKAESELESARQVVTTLEKRREQIEQDIAALQTQRQPDTLAAETGDREAAKRLDESRRDLIEKRTALEDIGTAIAEAQKIAEQKEAAVERAIQARELAEIERLISEHCVLAQRVQDQITAVAPAVSEYRQSLRRIAAVLGRSGASQFFSSWRIEALLSANWSLGATAHPAHAKAVADGLAEFERRWLEGEVLIWRNKRSDNR